WHVVEVKSGRRLTEFFGRPGGRALRAWLDEMPNEQYQSLFGLAGDDLRKRFLDGATVTVAHAVADLDDAALGRLVTDLGGHDIAALLGAYAACESVTDRPSVIFAYTVKDYGLPIVRNHLSHSAVLSAQQI